MATYQIPRNVKGESRILLIFSPKALLYTAIGGGLGYIIKTLISTNSFFFQIGIILFFGAIGFAIATFKVPEISRFEFTKKISGEKIDEIIVRTIKFKMKKNRIYVYTKEEKE